jgi:hypothetical protein
VGHDADPARRAPGAVRPSGAPAAALVPLLLGRARRHPAGLSAQGLVAGRLHAAPAPLLRALPRGPPPGMAAACRPAPTPSPSWPASSAASPGIATRTGSGGP